MINPRKKRESQNQTNGNPVDSMFRQDALGTSIVLGQQ
jgi:hypothetical protein